jgi:glutaredoxin
MVKVKIYGAEYCPYCKIAKTYFEGQNVELEYLQVSNEELLALSKKTGLQTIPQIFINDTLIGGWITTKKIIDDGKMDSLLSESQ